MTATVPVPVRLGRRSDRPGRAGTAPETGPLVDPFGRIHSDLRISVTDRCNLRCSYCMADEDQTFRSHDEILTFAEIERVARAARSLGITALRLTGGEPLVRAGLVDLVGRLGRLGFDDLALTTNGTALARFAPALAAAGLQRVNVSCDSLRPERFARIRRRGELGAVLAAMDAAEGAGLCPVKVNVVLQRGVNDDEILDFVAFGRATGREVRFIEFMPLDAEGRWARDAVVPSAEVVARINARLPLQPVAVRGRDVAPATAYRFLDGGGRVGVVATVTEPFCGTCNRLRLTADGAVRNCLFSDDELSLRDLLRGHGSDDDIALVFRRAVWGKRAGHGIGDPAFLRPGRTMSMIGG
ncbi:MAG TPA: GTP 3',8-cyclase MoaA [Acidimicrobiales bacterium]|nr:GTP 3',8-cyclase MoaA [Acidimicrobiales bacterium]